MTQEQIQEMHKRFDAVVFSTEQDLLGNDIKVLNAEHLGDVQSKLIPRIKEFVQEEVDKAVTERENEIISEIKALVE